MDFFSYEGAKRIGSENILSMPIDAGTTYYETTGTTGKPLFTPRTWLEAICSNAHFTCNITNLLSSNPDFEKRPIVGILGPTELHSLGDAIGDVLRNSDISHVKFWPYSPKVGMQRAAELIPEIGINVLFGTPAVILPIVRTAKAMGENFYRDFSKTVELNMTLGEVTSPNMRKNISSLFANARCQAGAYGGTELKVVSSSCRHGHMHVADQNYIMEVIDPMSLRPVEEGSVGELVLTDLTPGIRPLIRYRTGDLVSLDNTPCPCGNPNKRMTNHGPLTDIVQINEAFYFASDIEQTIMRGVTGAYGYRISIDTKNGRDAIYVQYEFLSDEGRDMVDKASVEASHYFGCPVSATVVDELPAVVNTGGFLTWKSARILDRRSSGDVDTEISEDLAHRWLNGYTPNFGNA